MKSPRRKINILIACLLAVGIVGIGFAVNRQIQADRILPGYATAHLHFEIIVPASLTVKAKAIFTPEQGKRYYFKEREFTFTTPGLNTVEWYIRKIPRGQYKATVTSDQGSFAPSLRMIYLEENAINDIDLFSLDLGSPPTPTPTATLESTPLPESYPGSGEYPFPPESNGLPQGNLENQPSDLDDTGAAPPPLPAPAGDDLGLPV